MEKFDYTKAMAELESIAARIEDPSTGLEDIDKYIARSRYSQCRISLTATTTL